MFPVYKGTYERQMAIRADPNGFRDVDDRSGPRTSRASSNTSTTRPDLDRDRIGYYGVSFGAFAGIMNAPSSRGLKASVLAGGGLVRAACLPRSIL